MFVWLCALLFEQCFDEFFQITGAGDKAFCAGFDLKWLSENLDVRFSLRTGFAGLTARKGLYKPVIAAVNGLAVGGGIKLNNYPCPFFPPSGTPKTLGFVFQDGVGRGRGKDTVCTFMGLQMMILLPRL